MLDTFAGNARSVTNATRPMAPAIENKISSLRSWDRFKSSYVSTSIFASLLVMIPLRLSYGFNFDEVDARVYKTPFPKLSESCL